MKQHVILLMALIASALPLRAQWTQTAGPEGGRLRAIAGNTEILLAVTWGDDLYRYDGTRWDRIGSMSAGSLIEHNGVFLASTNDRGLVRSTDDGDSWEVTAPDLRFAPLASSTAAVYASYRDTLFHSTDNGSSWSILTTPPVRYITAIKSVESTIIIGADGDTSPRLVSVSFDGGATWKTEDIPAAEEAYITSVEIVGDTLVAGFGQAGVFISADGGLTWEEFNNGLIARDGYDYSIETLTQVGGG